ncbi:hypothetical protein [Ferriphaselus sp. R-1]|uniref:hypothetical protein n=1 Tax=Ferriphaselus sp. R-1 TaxID=1485544 RepID=UPI000558F290|nr:hypothetical protein [Ferriphaselus sp. R-1]
MKQKPRFQLNRAAVVIRYKQPYVDWARVAGPEPATDYSLEQANDDGEMFLIPSYDSPVDAVDGTGDAIKWVEKRWKMLFEYFLGEWILDESAWPQKRTLKMFREWFEVEYRSIVWDMGHEPLMIDEWIYDEDDGMDCSVVH